MQDIPIHWPYFMSLEQDLVNAGRYVEICPANFKTYSTEFTRILLASCSEVDVVAKVACDKINSAGSATNIDEYRAIILSHRPEFPTASIYFPRHSLKLRPWESWAMGRNPGWWRAHTNVKHRRHIHFAEANLENALNATAGLFAMLMLCFGGFYGQSHGPIYFRWEGFR